MNVADATSTQLLILPGEQTWAPFNPEGLTRGQGTERTLNERYRGALVVDRALGVFRIERIERTAPWGTGRLRQLWSRLNDAWRITVHLEGPLALDLAAITDPIARYVDESFAEFIPAAADVPRLQAAVRACTTLDELFEVLHLPPPEEALDVL